MTTQKTGVGIVGCGNIFQRYVSGIREFDTLDLVRVADVDLDLAKKVADENGIPAYGTPEDLYADPAVQIVVNITPPNVHARVTEAAFAAGKHVFVEKPMVPAFADAQQQVADAKAKGLTLGVAPDTFLGSSAQTARKLIDDGVIGEPVGAVAFVTHSQAETWHPDPSWLFKPGGGPMLDMGPYYVSGLVNLLGPVETVYGKARIGAEKRFVTTEGRRVDEIDVEINTHAAAVLSFKSGVQASVMMSFDVWNHTLPYIEVYGTKGVVTLADPNNYDGDVKYRLHHDAEWTVAEPAIAPLAEITDMGMQFFRGPGVADLAASLNGAPHRAAADLGLHVLEVLEAISAGTPVTLTTTCERPAAV